MIDQSGDTTTSHRLQCRNINMNQVLHLGSQQVQLVIFKAVVCSGGQNDQLSSFLVAQFNGIGTEVFHLIHCHFHNHTLACFFGHQQGLLHLLPVGLCLDHIVTDEHKVGAHGEHQISVVNVILGLKVDQFVASCIGPRTLR
eukprot:TRINITY_DN6845_c0_g1_i2.p1 TRINITY_DN6845_c0_g1~~TRINITY_DN6845_c0_g1_i2.p1  ORF type:complete len:142 (-),score=19.60 TRINITY_DN6845_c0_g1_i2:26-451(-)